VFEQHSLCEVLCWLRTVSHNYLYALFRESFTTMPCCVIYENNLVSREAWPNYQYISCFLCDNTVETKGQSVKRDLRLFGLLKSTGNRIQCLSLILASVLSLSFWFTLCGIPMLIAACNNNAKMLVEMQDLARTEGRGLAYCVCCTCLCAVAMENKPEEIDIQYNAVIVAGSGAINNNNNNNVNTNVNVTAPAQQGTTANDIMLMQQMQFNQMMQASLLQSQFQRQQPYPDQMPQPFDVSKSPTYVTGPPAVPVASPYNPPFPTAPSPTAPVYSAPVYSAEPSTNKA
jgi:hypothetical protein